MGSGRQMNRLLQGDVGSGKTLVALLSMLLAVDNHCQACMMAPTEILATQHYATVMGFLKDMDIKVALLTGSTKKKERNKILPAIASGEIQLVIGTHALIEETVVFSSLGLAIIDEQHRFRWNSVLGCGRKMRLSSCPGDDCDTYSPYACHDFIRRSGCLGDR